MRRLDSGYIVFGRAESVTGAIVTTGVEKRNVGRLDSANSGTGQGSERIWSDN